MGEFAGWDTVPRKEVDEAFRKAAREHLTPSLQHLFDKTPTRFRITQVSDAYTGCFFLTIPRCGLRPYSADGIILLGRVSGLANLSLNVGPGFNGWKISVGAAEVLAASLEGSEVKQLPEQPKSLLPGNRVWKSRGWATVMAKTRTYNIYP